MIPLTRGQSHEYSIFSRDKTFNQKPYFLLRECAKTHLQQCRISKFSGGEPSDPPLQGEGRGGERRGGEGRGEGEREGSREEIGGEVAPCALVGMDAPDAGTTKSSPRFTR